VKPETRKLKEQISKMVEPLRLKCDFILRNGNKAGKKCGRRAKKTKINGLAEINTALCWRHRKILHREFIADMVTIES